MCVPPEVTGSATLICDLSNTRHFSVSQKLNIDMLPLIRTFEHCPLLRFMIVMMCIVALLSHVGPEWDNKTHEKWFKGYGTSRMRCL